MKNIFVALLPILALAACGGDSTKTPASATTDGPSTSTSVASFAQIQSQILTPSCATTGCHVGSTAQGGLALTPDVAYDNLVNVKPTNPNAVTDGLKRVMPGKPDSSLLYHKLVFPPGHHVSDYGNPMPTGTAGVTQGQLEYVRQWIAAGAPKSGNVVTDATLLADRNVQVTTPFIALAAPASGAGYQMKVDKFDVSANFERELFDYRKVGNTSSDVFVSRIETNMRPYSHHFVLYTFNPAMAAQCALLTPTVDQVRDIRNTDGSMNYVNMLAMGCHEFFAGSMTQQSNYVFPAGTALRVPANASIDLNVHYANHTNNSVPGEAYVNLYTVPQSQVVHALSTLNLSQTTIGLPAGQRTVITKTFTMSATTTVLALTSHMHARGEKFQIYIVRPGKADELVYENTDWEHPQIQTYATPYVLQKGDGLKSLVTYNNTTSAAIFFGLTSDQEMDIIFGYYY